MDNTERNAALAKFQGLVPTIEKTKQVNIPLKTGRTIKYNYADLADIVRVIKKPLAECELSFTQGIVYIDNIPYLETTIHHPKGEPLSTLMRMDYGGTDIKGQGSALTYYRRYSLSAALGLVTDDDVDAVGDFEASKDPQIETRALSWEEAETIKREAGDRLPRVLSYFNVDDASKLPAASFNAIMNSLKTKRTEK